MVCLLHELLPTEVKAFSPSFWAGAQRCLRLRTCAQAGSEAVRSPGDCFLDVTKAFYREVGGGKVHKGSWLKLILTFFKLKKMQDEARKTVPEDGNLLNVRCHLACDFSQSPCCSAFPQADQSMSTLPQPQRLIGQAAQLIGSQRQLVQGEIMVMGGMLVVKKVRCWTAPAPCAKERLVCSRPASSAGRRCVLPLLREGVWGPPHQGCGVHAGWRLCC